MLLTFLVDSECIGSSSLIVNLYPAQVGEIRRVFEQEHYFIN